ncbi:MAG: hypothetical protein DHS20C08_11770 [Rhodomicrobium sp.]|nr:MAG: hypothetical protein DHS20C08_11770 [Rhodomicrobium sp.]
MRKYGYENFYNAVAVPSVCDVAAAERAYARHTRHVATSIEAWEGENTESEWLHLDADMCERHADMMEDTANPDSSESYMQVVNEYVSMVEHNTHASGIYSYLSPKYLEQLNVETETQSADQSKLTDVETLEKLIEVELTEYEFECEL